VPDDLPGSRPPTDSPGPRLPACRILLVEDEPANRALVRAILARADPERYDLVEVETVAEACEIMIAGPPHVVVLDVRLPDGSGLDLAGELCAESGPGRPAVIVMSASVLPAERARALAAGVNRFIAKPFAATELLDALQTYCPGPERPPPSR
jgi:CheY-like chemotaxis protein